jgi:hypothetical protein
MAGDLQPGFTNNINIMQIRTSGSSMQRVTDRAIDFDGDGNKEVVTLTPGVPAGGNKFNPPATVSGETGSLLGGDNAGVARSVVQEVTETDLGVNTTGEEFTEGVE